MITLNIDKRHAVILDSASALNEAAGNRLLEHALDAMSWNQDALHQALGFVGRWDKERLVKALCHLDLQMVEDTVKEVIDSQ